ncbi:craniofacial development protein 2-like [Diaphorina citri]|uniref:Craniofacial development protein 2-like n=1 Tax=Diaphorina citri TaxID=121845 RepID=A0A1S4ELA5_DIACI|nr:craniofacial development protein 2-like [Diaphorina citri]
MTTNSLASDETLPCDLTGPQRMPVGTHMTGCVKYASMSNKPSKQDKQKNVKIATWNVRGLNNPGKLDNVLNEIKNLEADICGLSETFWNDSSDFNATLPCGENFRIIYSGGDQRRRGVAFVLNQKVSHLVNSVHIVSERVIGIKINTTPVNTFIIQAYAPTLDSNEEEKNKFYDDLNDTLKHKAFQEILIVMGDFNAKVGNSKIDNIVGPHGLGTINSAGQDLINFCNENNMFICNTWFYQKQSARHTWTSPDGNHKNQIDFICVNNRFRNSITNAKSRPGADCGSDHNPVIINLRIKLKKLMKPSISKKWNLTKAKCPVVKNQFSSKISNKLENINKDNYQSDNINQNWTNLKEVINSTAEEVVGKDKSKAKKKWMTQEILNLMEERKKLKNGNEEERKKYKDLNRTIQKLCRHKKEEFLNNQCMEAERLEAINSASFHKKLKELTQCPKKLSYCLLDKNGLEIYESEQMLERWKEYCENLYKDNRPPPPSVEVNDEEIPQFTNDNIKEIIKKLSNDH